MIAEADESACKRFFPNLVWFSFHPCIMVFEERISFNGGKKHILGLKENHIKVERKSYQSGKESSTATADENGDREISFKEFKD